MKKLIFISAIFMFIAFQAIAQTVVKGLVLEYSRKEHHHEPGDVHGDEHEELATEKEEHHDTDEHDIHDVEKDYNLKPLAGVNLYWLGTFIGTTTGEHGKFVLEVPELSTYKLVVSYVGYKSDTLAIDDLGKELEIVLTSNAEIDEVIISRRLRGSYISRIDPIKTEVITNEGLTRLACCNLSESFENTATVDVSYSDAVTGAKQIRMLGLAGQYSQILLENLPVVRGLERTYGLSYIPGAWMESIQVSKGSSSVINGYESVTGQINVEVKKPENADPLFLNLYQNNEGRSEANLSAARKFNKKLSTVIHSHGSYMKNRIDHNGDGFLDVPENQVVNLFNKWQYFGKRIESQFALSYLSDNRDAGQLGHNVFMNPDSIYRIGVRAQRLSAFTKTGYSFDREGTSLGVQARINRFENNSVYGFSNYSGYQDNAYVNMIYQSYLGNSNHLYSVGLSYQYDRIDEKYAGISLAREEYVPGAFAQYTFQVPGKFTAIPGIRVDENSYYGTLVTPRLHLKYNATERLTLRASGGKGYHSVSIFAYNPGLMASSKNIVIDEQIEIEEAWNYGFNLTQKVTFDNTRDMTISLDLYRTDFINQVIVDMEQDPLAVHFYNLEGESFSNSAQLEVLVVPAKRIDITAAIRYNEVKATINDRLLDMPFVSKYKGLLSFSYATTMEKWKLDVTNQFNGSGRLPSMDALPAEYRLGNEFPAYYILHAQLTRKFKWIELYVGGENLTDFRQLNSVVSASDPYSPYFDTSKVWGPVNGRMWYAGLRYTIK